MKLATRIVAGAALLGAFTTASAESITFGVEIPPIASIRVSQGLLVSSKALEVNDATALTTLTAPFVGAFTVSTNMPKWNIYFSLANNGYLVDQSGNYLKSNSATLPFLGLGVAAAADALLPGRVWLRFPGATEINGTDGAATPTTIVGTGANFGATSSTVSNSGSNTLTKVLDAGTATYVDDGWVHATKPTTATIGIGTAFSIGSDKVNAIAGTYTETLYLTLVTAY